MEISDEKLDSLAKIVKNRQIKDIDTLRTRILDFVLERKKENKIAEILQNHNGEERIKWQKKQKCRLFVRNKTSGIYYVQYLDDSNKNIGCYFSCHTQDVEQAKQYAVANREKILAEYYQRNDTNLGRILRAYYSENSPYLAADKIRKHKLTNDQRVKCAGYMVHYYIPFFQQRGVMNFTQVTLADIEASREFIMNDLGLSSKTCNTATSALRRVFERLYIEKVIPANPFSARLSVINNTQVKERSCFSPAKMVGFFTRDWEPENMYYYMLALTAFQCGFRNSEIGYLRVKNIIHVNNIYFYDLHGTKTRNASRFVPLHSFYIKKLQEWIKSRELTDNDYIFRPDGDSKIKDSEFVKAVQLTGKKLGYSPQKMQKENITFYGFRHEYKTILDLHNIPLQITEYVMGHSKGRDVSLTYSHLDKAPQTTIAQPIIKVFDEYFQADSVKTYS
jgi:integrase